MADYLVVFLWVGALCLVDADFHDRAHRLCGRHAPMVVRRGPDHPRLDLGLKRYSEITPRL